MKHFYTLTLTILLVLTTNTSKAQTYALNWLTDFLSPWSDGNINGTANNIGGSPINATVSVTNTQPWAFWFFSLGNFTSPKVNGSPFTTQLGSNVSNMAIGVDWWDETDYIDIVFSFGQAVKNVTFNVADIDKAAANSNDYIDEIVVTGTNGGSPVTNPTITKLVAGSTYVNISGNVATANTTNGQGGNSASSTSDQNGTVVVNFGSTLLTSVTIRYRNNSASQSNPDAQAIAIGNVSFQSAGTLPVQLISFNGSANNNQVKLNWLTAQEANAEKFIVEKSADGVSWQTLSTVPAIGNSNSTKEYSTIDANPLPLNYYRLKQVDANSSYTYSQVIRMRTGANENTDIKLYPNPVLHNAAVSINSDKEQAGRIKLYNQSGMLINDLQRRFIKGNNNVNIPHVNGLLPGVYMVIVENETGNKIGTTRFIKQ